MIEKDLEKLEQGVLDNESMMTLRALRPWQEERYRRTDIGNSNLFADFFGDRARYMQGQNCWYVYDGRVWHMDESGLAVRALAKALAVLLFHYTREITDPILRDMAQEQEKRWQSRKGRGDIIAEAEDVYPLQMDMMDADPMMLNCQNGTLDLSTGVLHPHTSSDLLTRMAGAEFVRGLRCERWEQFILEVMRKSGGQISLADEEEARQKALWLRRVMGYALSGETKLECMFILYGMTTRNGKSTLMETMLRLMGSYGLTMQPESLGIRPDGRGPSEDLARLRGARLVNASEPDKRLRLSASLVKTLTGNDTITARGLYQNSFEYHPRFKLFLNTNHLPETGDCTLFDSRRIHVIPFERHFAPQEQDRNLKQFLAMPICLSGILNWCLDGLSDLRENGFSLEDPPESMRRALNAYRAENDLIGQFIKECLKPTPGAVSKAYDVYRTYAAWCDLNGHPQESAIAFRKALAPHFRLAKGRIGGGNVTNVVHDCEVRKQDVAG